MDSLLSLLVADDPRRAADRILGTLVANHRAQGGAVIRPDGDRATVFVSEGLPLDCLAKLSARWKAHLAALRKGLAVVEKQFALAPVRQGGELVAALYLEEPHEFDADEIALFATALGHAVHAATAPRGEAPLASLGSADLMKRQLLVMLENNAWNIARVARLMGVTRRTVYLRLKSHGIARKKVPKTLKPIPAGAE